MTEMQSADMSANRPFLLLEPPRHAWRKGIDRLGLIPELLTLGVDLRETIGLASGLGADPTCPLSPPQTSSPRPPSPRRGPFFFASRCCRCRVREKGVPSFFGGVLRLPLLSGPAPRECRSCSGWAGPGRRGRGDEVCGRRGRREKRTGLPRQCQEVWILPRPGQPPVERLGPVVLDV